MEHQPIDRLQLKQLEALMDVVVGKFAVECKLRKPYMSLNQAYKMYGRKTVDRWIEEGLIDIMKDGTNTSKCRILRERIELVAAMSNRASWYEHHE